MTGSMPPNQRFSRRASLRVRLKRKPIGYVND